MEETKPLADKGAGEAADVKSVKKPLKLRYLFGLGATVADNIHYVDETEVLYPCGHYVVLYDTEKRTQKFMSNHKAFGGAGLSAMTADTSTKGKILAVAEKGDHNTRAAITIYDYTTQKKKRPSFSPTDMISKEIVSMSISPDGQQLLTQGGAPDWVLTNWQWGKGRVAQSLKIPNPTGADIYQCSYCPTDPACVCITGNGILKFFRIEMAAFKPIRYSLGNREPQNYLCHAWIDDRLLVGTNSGDILVFVNAEYRGILDSSPSNGCAIHTIATFSKGFVCGCDQALLYVFERDEKKMYKQKKLFQIDGNFEKIMSLAVSPSEDTVACTLGNSQAYVLSISNNDIRLPEDMNFEPLVLPFHHNAITGLDVCLRKPLVVTCGIDKSIRVWNYVDKSIECIRFFENEPYSVAFHPSGFHVLAGFHDSLQFMNILMDEMKTVIDFEITLAKVFPIKGCHEVRFSNGGHLFAAVDGSLVKIYHTYSCQLMCTLTGHAGKVTSLTWSSDDCSIYSAGVDGSVFQWSIAEQSVIVKHIQKGCNYTSVLGDKKEMYVVGSDKQIKHINGGEVKTAISTTNQITQITWSARRKLLIGGADTGNIIVYPTPIGSKGGFRFNCHHGACTRLRVSPEGRYLFTVSEDGSMSMFELLVDYEKETKDDDRLPWSEDILVTKSDLENKLTMMIDLKNKVEELQHQNQVQLSKRHLQYKGKIDDVVSKFTAELAADKNEYGILEKSKADKETEFEVKMKMIQKRHKKMTDDLKTHHTQKLKTESERTEKLKLKRERAEVQWAQSLQDLAEKNQKELTVLRRENRLQLQDRKEERKDFNKAKEVVDADFKDTQDLMEEDIANEFEDLKKFYEKKLKEEQAVTLDLKNNNAMLRRQDQKLTADIKKNQVEVASKLHIQQNKRTKISNLQKDLEAHGKEIEERHSTIVEKEKRIQELRKRNQELEKFKFVLDYKISELHSQNEPREEESRRYVKQLGEMRTEVGNYENKNAVLKLNVEDNQQKLKGVDQSIGSYSEQYGTTLALKKKMQLDIKSLGEVTDHKKMSKIIKVLHAEYNSVESGSKRSANDSLDVRKEYLRNRNYLEKNVDTLKRQLKKDMLQNKRDYDRIVKENVVIVREINTLQREYQIQKETNKLKEIRAEEKRRSRSRRKMGVSRKTMLQSKGMNPEDLKRQIQSQQEQISVLKEQLAELAAQQNQTTTTMPAGKTLPPLNSQ